MVETATFIVTGHMRPKKRRAKCFTIVQASAPSRPIPKTREGEETAQDGRGRAPDAVSTIQRALLQSPVEVRKTNSQLRLPQIVMYVARDRSRTSWPTCEFAS